MGHTKSHRSGYALSLLCIACCVCDLTPGEHGHLFPGVDEQQTSSRRKQKLARTTSQQNGELELTEAPRRDSDVSRRGDEHRNE
tara:strand:+ start:10151 stop:10402 length:252 start_codon:yes stop_codon:yes gene_type:complete